MENWINKVAFIPNFANEIGVITAEALVGAGMLVIGFYDENNIVGKLNFSESKCYESKIFLYPCKIGNIESIQSTFYHAIEKHGGVDILINIINCESECLVSNGDLKVMKRIADLNILGIASWIRLAAGSMLERNLKGHIITMTEHKKPGELNSIVRTASATIESVNEILRHEFRYLHASIKTSHIKYIFEDSSNAKNNKKNIAELVKLVMDTPDHLQIHEMQLTSEGE